MRLHWLTLHWERLARRDPFFAVLTDVNKRFGHADLEAFYRSGTEEIAAVLGRADERGLAVPRRRALDFGCGVGRLTQALAETFERCDGVDISSAMLAVARRHCRRPERCHFHRNVAENLSLFEDEAFTFVYSTLVLQHMVPRTSATYIGELVRVLSGDGLLVFQLPAHVVAREPTSGDRRTAVVEPLPGEAFQARLSMSSTALAGHAGERMLIEVGVANVSPHPWPALPDVRGRHQINVANRWLDGNGLLLQRDDERAGLPHDVPAGGAAEVLLGVRPPTVNGRYLLEIDLVQENVGWFSEHGSPTLRVPCDVTGGVDGPPLRPIEKPARSSRVPRFSERHPRMFGVLRATGLRNAYWTARRALDSVKSRRDAAIRRSVHPLLNRWERVSFRPRMEMHCIPASEVRALVESHGGRVIHVDEEMLPGGYLSCRYWVTKP